MILRRPASLFFSLLVLPIALSLAGCSSLQQISITPAAGSVVLTAVGQTAQYQAVGVSQMGNGEATTSSITSSVSWSSSNPAVATINSSGVATAVGAGHTLISAESAGVIASSDATVTLGSGTGSSGSPTITVTPGTATDTFIGETTQFIATGSLTGVGSPTDLTTQVQWSSSNVQVASIGAATGLATAVGNGTTTITAKSGGIISTSVLTVTVNSASATPSLAIIPSSGATATFAGETTQFIALGNLTGGFATQNLTSSVAWSSSDISVASIDKNGLATAVGANTQPISTTITAIGTTSTGSLITATTTLTVQPTGSIVNLPVLDLYMVGSGSGTVVSSPGTVNCGSAAAGATCTGNFPLNSVVTLTAAPSTGSVFGGWSSNCLPVIGNPNPLVCTVQMKNNETVGAVFNP